MRHTVSVFVLLSFIWLSNSGFFTPLFLFYGVVAVAFVIWLARKMDVVDHESQPVHLTRRLPTYYWWLLIKIIQANIEVVKHIWRPTLAISPCTATIEAGQQTDMGKVIYANSITLTPGTVALDLDGDKIKVHSLTRGALEELQSGDMNRRVNCLER
jgi:multicomponent Na+:H+ antiporter subunit E